MIAKISITIPNHNPKVVLIANAFDNLSYYELKWRSIIKTIT